MFLSKEEIKGRADARGRPGRGGCPESYPWKGKIEGTALSVKKTRFLPHQPDNKGG